MRIETFREHREVFFLLLYWGCQTRHAEFIRKRFLRESVALIVGTVLFAVNGAIPAVSDAQPGEALNVYDFEAGIVDASGSVIGASMYCMLICGALVSALIAMVFRDVYLICRFTLGKSRHAKGAVSFQPDNVRMVREIGIFAIAVPIVQLVFNIILHRIIGFDAEVSGFAYMGIVFGVAMLCLCRCSLTACSFSAISTVSSRGASWER